MDIARAVANLLNYTNNAVNLYIYCLTGSQFRSEVVALFSCRVTSSQPNADVTRSQLSAQATPLLQRFAMSERRVAGHQRTPVMTDRNQHISDNSSRLLQPLQRSNGARPLAI